MFKTKTLVTSWIVSIQSCTDLSLCSWGLHVFESNLLFRIDFLFITAQSIYQKCLLQITQKVLRYLKITIFQS